ncbi:MAG: 1-acyl-sn-glycerol-3-phosphate acyltransferase [Tannerellaceae bacterium]|jgi:1-acyl-sn-glycerol-3-phosphate acyltransferase|nr:1-acyl-sn-glycerol-3-phosphate acyltransferase [Tannerellaceae bacterium]
MTRILYYIYMRIFFLPIFLLLTLLTALTTMAGCLLGGERIFSYYPGMLWSRASCYLALCPVKVSGREHIRKGQSYIFASNHQGAFDIFLIYGFLGTPLKWIMKDGLRKIPFVGAACRAAGFIFVDHSTPQAAARSLQKAEQSLSRGASIAIFPEGSRTRTGGMNRFKKGAFRMAADLRLPIVPITLNGPYKILPIGSLNPSRHRMEMIIHPPVPVEDATEGPQSLEQLAARTHQIIASGLWPEFRI